MKIRYDEKEYEIKSITMVADENNPESYVYAVTFVDSPNEVEYLPIDEVEIL